MEKMKANKETVIIHFINGEKLEIVSEAYLMILEFIKSHPNNHPVYHYKFNNEFEFTINFDHIMYVI